MSGYTTTLTLAPILFAVLAMMWWRSLLRVVIAAAVTLIVIGTVDVITMIDHRGVVIEHPNVGSEQLS